MVTLRFLEPKDESAFRDALADDWGDFTFAHFFEKGMAFADFLTRLESIRTGSGVKSGDVPGTALFGFVTDADGKERCVGRVSIRHKLNEALATVGGHIGYGVRPGDRKKGYATEMLGQALNAAKMIGIEKALLTCDDKNLGSIRTIERNGGYLEGTVADPVSGVLKRRYWINL